MKKPTFGILIATLIILSYMFDLQDYVRLEVLKANIDVFQQVAREHAYLSATIFFLVYVLMTALSIPGAVVLTLAAGSVFGLVKGTLLVSFASAIGASGALMISRYLFRDVMQKKFGHFLNAIDSGLRSEGAFYLFTLRLIPIFPFFLINLVMGLTAMPVRTFYWVSQIGMLFGTMAYINAGTELSKIDSLSGVLSFRFLASFVVLGLFPWVAKKAIDVIKKRRVYKPFRSQKPRTFDYDMVVIGGGSAGLVSAYIAATVKAKVALIEQHQMGGDCLNTGCVPSKALIKTAHVVFDAKNSSKYGIKKIDIDFDFADVMSRVHEIVKKIAPHDSIERYTSLGVECLSAKAKITSPWTVEANGRTFSTRNIVLASGATPIVPLIPGLETIGYLTSDTLWGLKELPKRLIVLGGGPIGCELAQCFSRLGSQVTLIEILDRIMAVEDEDVSDVIAKHFRNEGVDIFVKHKPLSFIHKNEKKILICDFSGEKKEFEFDAILLAVGRKARTKGYGLEDLGIELRANGTVLTNDFLQTKYPNIFACGDVTGPYQFTHTAAHQAWFCAVNGLFGSFKKFKVDYRVIPWCTFTDPEVAVVGLTEKAAQQKGIPYEVTRYHFDDLDRAIADGQDHGFVKVLTVPGKDKILGAAIVGSQASNLILEFVSAMKYGFGLSKILSTIHVYPSMGEANKYVAGVWKKAHVSPHIFRFLEKYFQWMRS